MLEQARAKYAERAARVAVFTDQYYQRLAAKLIAAVDTGADNISLHAHPAVWHFSSEQVDAMQSALLRLRGLGYCSISIRALNQLDAGIHQPDAQEAEFKLYGGDLRATLTGAPNGGITYAGFNVYVRVIRPLPLGLLGDNAKSDGG